MALSKVNIKMFGNGDSYEHADGKTEYLF